MPSACDGEVVRKTRPIGSREVLASGPSSAPALNQVHVQVAVVVVVETARRWSDHLSVVKLAAHALTCSA